MKDGNCSQAVSMVTDHRDGCQAASDRGVFRGHHQLMAEDNPAHVYCAFLDIQVCLLSPGPSFRLSIGSFVFSSWQSSPATDWQLIQGVPRLSPVTAAMTLNWISGRRWMEVGKFVAAIAQINLGRRCEWKFNFIII